MQEAVADKANEVENDFQNYSALRDWGFVPRENVIGNAVAIYWPPSRAGLIK